jgi:hypothetical protein
MLFGNHHLQELTNSQYGFWQIAGYRTDVYISIAAVVS